MTAAAIAVACGSPSGDVQVRAGSPGPSPTTELLYTCGQMGFDPALLEGPGNLERQDSELGEALRALFETSEGSRLSDTRGWRIMAETPEQAEAIAPSGDAYESALLRRSDDGWEATGFGDCNPRVVVGNRSLATWAPVEKPKPSDTEIVLAAKEIACSSGRKLTEDNTRADVTYEKDEITVVISGDPIKGGNCIGNLPWELTVELDEPVGDRILLDASTYPPRHRS